MTAEAGAGAGWGALDHRAALDLLTVPVGVVACLRDPSGTVVDFEIVYVNRAVDALMPPSLPLSLPSLSLPAAHPGPVGRRVGELWPTLADPDTLRRAAAVADTGEPWAFRLPTAGSGLVPEWIEGVVSRLGDGLLVSLHDVSDVQKGRRELSEAQNAYRALLEALPDRVVAVYDDELRVRLITGRAFTDRGLRLADVVGTPVLDLLTDHRASPDLPDRLRAALDGEHLVVPRVTSASGRSWRLDVAPLPGLGAAGPTGMIVALDVTAEETARRERDRTLWELQQAQRVARTGSWSWDARTGELWRSAEHRRLVGLPQDAPEPELRAGLTALTSRSPDGPRLAEAWARILVDRRPFAVELRLGTEDGGLRHLVVRAEAVLDEDGEVAGVRGTTQDVTDAHEARLALAESEERFRLAFDESPIGKGLLSPPPDAGRVLRANRALGAILGRPAAEVVGSVLADWVRPDDREAALGALPGERVEVRLTSDQGRQTWAGLGATAVRDVSGRTMYLLVQVEDVTARRDAETELVRQARFDPLTGLPNRVSLLQHLEGLLAAGSRVAVSFFDLDDFKTVNDSLGHAAGDELLRRVAVQIERCVAGEAFAARWGGDEFVVVSTGHLRPAAARSLADRVRLAVSVPVDVDGHELTATASVGVALGAAGSTAEGLLRDADIAMYRAKAAGKDRSAMAEAAGHEGALRRLTLSAALRHALDDEQLYLHYQPVVDIVDGRIVSVEALLRWQHPKHGTLSPADFLDVAESSALIVPVGEWALRTAAFQAMEWYRRFGSRAPTVAVNVSVRQLGHSLLHERVAAALADSGLPPSRLCVELTEREAVAASGSEAADLQSVHTSGVQLAVDDFGTGYAGLDYLRRFPVDILKIDQSFVRGLGTDPTDTAIIVSLITLGRALDLTVVAEGVEDQAQHAMLRRLECPQGQGRLWSPPVGAERIAELLERPIAATSPP